MNSVCIEIEPLNSNTNVVKVKTTNDMALSNWVIHQEHKFVSDQNLAVIVRKMALHADLASRVYRFQKDSNPYGGKWYERLKQINRIRKTSKEHYAKQLQQNKSTASLSGGSSVPFLGSNFEINSGNSASNQSLSSLTQSTNDNPIDFTDYI